MRLRTNEKPKDYKLYNIHISQSSHTVSTTYNLIDVEFLL